jgi:hypothetical protein
MEAICVNSGGGIFGCRVTWSIISNGSKKRKYPEKGGGVGYTFILASIIVCIWKNIGLHPASIVGVVKANSRPSTAMAGDGVVIHWDTEAASSGNLMHTPPPVLMGPGSDEISNREEGEHRIWPSLSNISSWEMDTPHVLHSHVSLGFYVNLVSNFVGGQQGDERTALMM